MLYHSFSQKSWWKLFVLAALVLLGCLFVAATADAHVGASSAPLSVSVAPNTLCGSLSFASPVTYTANIRPRSATTGYLNSDNNLDLVVTDYSNNSVSVFLGNIDGTFQTQVSYSAGVHPVSVAIADFNEDTKPDLVVSNYDSANVSILLGNGDGTFQGAMNYSSNIGPYGVTVGDFDENTHADVATSNVNFGTINVMLGNGNGSLQNPVPYQAGLRPQVIATGHFNPDSHVDLVVPNYTASSVSVFLGNGNGTFQTAITDTVTPYPDYLMVADVNNDIHDDLVLSHYATTDNIGVALGNGSGGFGPETTYSTGGDNPTFASVGDFNGDGILDLVSPGYESDNVSILLGNGNGTFQSPVSFSVASGSSPVALLPGDFNHDGRMDMITANENTNDISVFLSTCQALTTTPTTAPSATSTAASTNTPQATVTATLTSTPTTTPSATSTACASWQVVPSADEGTFDSYLNAVSAASANDIWAVGNYYNADFYAQTLVEHWNGSAWTVVDSPNPGTANNLLFGVAALSANNAWAVGWQSNTNIPEPLVLHWDGSAWTDFSVSFSRPRVVLQAISAVSQNDIWATGLSCDIAMCNRHITATVHWDGSAWSVVDSPNPATFDNTLEGVSAVSSNDVWAVGQACTGNGCGASESLIEHWDGSAWSVVTSPSPGAAITALLGVDAQAGGAWAVGEACADSTCAGAQSVVLHWNGTTWSTVPSPNPGSSDTHFNAVSMLSGGDAWAAGSESSDGTTFGNVVVHWDGSAWNTVSVASPGSANNDIFGLTKLSANDVWAVGDFDSGIGVHTQVQHYAGTCATPTVAVTATATATTIATAGASATVATATRTATIIVTATATATATSTYVLPTDTPELPTATPTSCTLRFSDVPQNSTFYPYIRCLACLGLINGYPDGTFKPNNNVTRGQLSKIVSNSAGFEDNQTTQMFQDVPTGSTFFQFIGRLASRGFIGGYPCGGAGELCGPGNLPYFRPNNNATRGQISKIVSNAAQFNNAPTGRQFEDVGVGSTYYTYTYRLVTRNVMSGYACGGPGEPCAPGNLPYFRPNNNATRGQTSKIVANTFFPDCSPAEGALRP